MTKSASAFVLIISVISWGCKPSNDKVSVSVDQYSYTPSWTGGQRLWNVTPNNQKDGITITEAFEAHKLAALEDDPLAQYALGLDYLIGRGTTKNESASSSWLIKSADQGNVSAQKVLAIMYSSGTGTEKDLLQSLSYWILIRDNFPESDFAEPPEPQVDGDFLNSEEAKKEIIFNGKKTTKGELHFSGAPRLLLGGIAKREIAAILGKITEAEAIEAERRASELALKIKTAKSRKSGK